jgi:uncharacterized protein (TIGR02646 family)
MIRIARVADGPKGLKEKGAVQMKKDCVDYDAAPKAFRTGTKKFSSKRSIYASKAVKKILSEVQYNKCCYCEKKFRAAINLAVEHFRPKTGVKQSRKAKQQCPGYYWLAYDWENLLLSCHDCNSTYKQILFPLANPGQRARSHHQKITKERALLINPVREEPRKHIRFREDAPEPITKRGRITIGILGLDRSALREDRLERIELLRQSSNLTKLAAKRPKDHELQKLAEKARSFLKSAILTKTEFSSMALDFSDGSTPPAAI